MYLCIVMKLIHCLLLLPALIGCSSKQSTTETFTAAEEVADTIEVPSFQADSAYAFVERQVAFGPRVPGSEAHRRCQAFFVDALRGFGADTVWTQTATVTAFDGTRLPMANIMASFNSAAPRRLLLVAHYDTRPWADEDADEANHSKPIPGANDGASGVGVILELARQVGLKAPGVGVDILLTDVEDYGDDGDDESWCLGTQYWVANNPYTPRTRPYMGILLDMVGGRDAQFYREGFSDRAARWVNDRVWTAAQAEGVGRFIKAQHGFITDDHNVVQQAGIPCIDIIEMGNPATGSFPPYWHTMADDMTNIDRATLRDVGQTLLRVIYSE